MSESDCAQLGARCEEAVCVCPQADTPVCLTNERKVVECSGTTPQGPFLCNNAAHLEPGNSLREACAQCGLL
jgi:hypothetical protein